MNTLRGHGDGVMSVTAVVSIEEGSFRQAPETGRGSYLFYEVDWKSRYAVSSSHVHTLGILDS